MIPTSSENIWTAALDGIVVVQADLKEQGAQEQAPYDDLHDALLDHRHVPDG